MCVYNCLLNWIQEKCPTQSHTIYQSCLKIYQCRNPSFRRITTFNELPTRERPEFIEFDIIGVVVKIEHMKENRKFEQVFLADAQKNLLRVSFWKGLSNFAYDDIVTLRAVLCFGNLQWRPSNSLPQLAVSELTVITENPKSEGHQKTLEELRQSLSGCNIQEFIEECMAKLWCCK